MWAPSRHLGTRREVAPASNIDGAECASESESTPGPNQTRRVAGGGCEAVMEAGARQHIDGADCSNEPDGAVGPTHTEGVDEEFGSEFSLGADLFPESENRGGAGDLAEIEVQCGANSYAAGNEGESESPSGRTNPRDAEWGIESDHRSGVPSNGGSMTGYEIPYADPITESIDLYRRSWDDLMRQRIRLENRAVDKVTGEMRSEFLAEMSEIIGTSEAKVRRQLEKLIREHPMADWLADAKTQGARVATILAMIRNPHRFPGQKCTEGCYTLPTFDEGEPCPSMTTPKDGEEPEPCTGTMLPPRRGTGCRALWHMAGLYPVQTDKGTRLATYRKGVQGSHNREAKTAILMPQGIAQQFYMQGSRYAETYYEAKARLREKHPDRADGWSDTTARVIAAKAWLGDLLMEWKGRVPLDDESVREIGVTNEAPAVALV